MYRDNRPRSGVGLNELLCGVPAEGEKHMQMYAGVTNNKMLDEPGSNGELGAIVELVILTNEVRYKYGAGGLAKDYGLNATRFMATPAALRELADYLVGTAADAESMAKAVNKAMNESKAVRESAKAT